MAPGSHLVPEREWLTLRYGLEGAPGERRAEARTTNCDELWSPKGRSWRAWGALRGEPAARTVWEGEAWLERWLRGEGVKG